MLDTFTSIQNHLDEVASALSFVTRQIAEYQKQIAELKPVADSLMDVADQVNAKKSELVDLDTKLKTAQASYRRLFETLQQV
jgi:uncharacterized protein YigA (DUF484 family)